MYSPQESLFLLAVLCQTIGKETRARWYYKNARRADARQRARASLFERLRGARLYMKRAGARALTRARGKYMARVTALYKTIFTIRTCIETILGKSNFWLIFEIFNCGFRTKNREKP